MCLSLCLCDGAIFMMKIQFGTQNTPANHFRAVHTSYRSSYVFLAVYFFSLLSLHPSRRMFFFCHFCVVNHWDSRIQFNGFFIVSKRLVVLFPSNQNKVHAMFLLFKSLSRYTHTHTSTQFRCQRLWKSHNGTKKKKEHQKNSEANRVC